MSYANEKVNRRSLLKAASPAAAGLVGFTQMVGTASADYAFEDWVQPVSRRENGNAPDGDECCCVGATGLLNIYPYSCDWDRKGVMMSCTSDHEENDQIPCGQVRAKAQCSCDVWYLIKWEEPVGPQAIEKGWMRECALAPCSSENYPSARCCTDCDTKAEMNGNCCNADHSNYTSCPGSCYITTATVGAGDTREELRTFRDEGLGRTPLGRLLTRIYYVVSPRVADTLDRHPESRTARIVRRLIHVCGGLAEERNGTGSAAKRLGLSTVLTVLYMIGVLVAVLGSVALSAGELIED